MKNESDVAADKDLATGLSPASVSNAVDDYLQLVDGDHQSTRLGYNSSRPKTAIFKDVKVWGSDSELEHLQTLASIFEAPMKLLRKLFSQRKHTKKVIVRGIDGFIQEGETLLLLGRPGSGCTTLLKTLAGSTETFQGWSGDIAYFGLPVNAVKKDYRGDLVYNAEGKSHITSGMDKLILCDSRCSLPVSYCHEDSWIRSQDEDYRKK